MSLDNERKLVRLELIDRINQSPKSGAWIDDTGRYRYALWRTFDESQSRVVFVGLNPSTADAELPDPTIRRCLRFARDWNYGGILMVNLFAYRHTSPKGLMKAMYPVGPLNNSVLAAAAESYPEVVCCWGAHGNYLNRAEKVRHDLRAVAPRRLFHLGLTKAGEPRHPLYLAASTPRQPLDGMNFQVVP